LASFDYEIRHALKRARDPNLTAMRLAWWREAISGERQAEAAGSPVAFAVRAAIDAYALPRAWLEAMLDARLQEIAPQEDFNLVAFRAFADESEGARLRLASHIAAGAQDLDQGTAVQGRVSANADSHRRRRSPRRECGGFRRAASRYRRYRRLQRTAGVSARRAC
jgi:hypothetical protein